MHIGSSYSDLSVNASILAGFRRSPQPSGTPCSANSKMSPATLSLQAIYTISTELAVEQDTRGRFRSVEVTADPSVPWPVAGRVDCLKDVIRDPQTDMQPRRAKPFPSRISTTHFSEISLGSSPALHHLYDQANRKPITRLKLLLDFSGISSATRSLLSLPITDRHECPCKSPYLWRSRMISNMAFTLYTSCRSELPAYVLQCREHRRSLSCIDTYMDFLMLMRHLRSLARYKESPFTLASILAIALTHGPFGTLFISELNWFVHRVCAI